MQWAPDIPLHHHCIIALEEELLEEIDDSIVEETEGQRSDEVTTKTIDQEGVKQ